jgi:hypothetical protein
MTKRRRKAPMIRTKAAALKDSTQIKSVSDEYECACITAELGKLDIARALFELLTKIVHESAFKARVQNDLATLVFLEGDREKARAEFEAGKRGRESLILI